MAKTIGASVGRSGVNRESDTTTIQKLLNRVPVSSGGPAPLLEVDGLCGPITKSTIQKFQLKHFGWSLADGRVDPGGPTLAKLNEFDTVTTQPPPHTQLPEGTRFMIVRMGTQQVVRGADSDLFFYVVDITNNLGAVYWLRPSGRPTTSLRPPGGRSFAGSGGPFHVNIARSIDALQCPAAWISREEGNSVSSTLVLGFPDSPTQIPMNHHLIGPGGMVSPSSVPGGARGASTALAGDLVFIECR